MAPGKHQGEWPVLLVWCLLIGASVAGVLLVEGLVPVKVAASAAIILAAIKIHIVFSQYMELRWHHRPLRQLLAAWLAAITAMLLTTYWMA